MRDPAPVRQPVVLALACLMLVVGCASSEPPMWLFTGHPSETGRPLAFYGIGGVSGVQDSSVAWKLTEHQARTHLTREITAFLQYLVSDYAASVGSSPAAFVPYQQRLEYTIQTISVSDVDRYRDRDTNSYYQLVKVNLADVVKQFEQTDGIEREFKHHIRAHAEQIFFELKTTLR